MVTMVTKPPVCVCDPVMAGTITVSREATMTDVGFAADALLEGGEIG